MADNKKLNELPNLGGAPAAADKVFIWDESAQAHKYVTYTDLVSQVVSDATAAVTAHANLTAAHGTTSNIVGTSDTQTLTNKTIISPAGIVKADVGLGNVTNDEQVKLAGDQTITGVKTFSSSPIVPDPTTATQATNKQWVEDYVEGIGKESVGLLTQGKFVDRITTNLRIKKQQSHTEVTYSGFPTFDSTHTLDGINFITGLGNGADFLFGEYSLSGSSFTPIFTQSIINGDNAIGVKVKYLSANYAIASYVHSSNTQLVQIRLMMKIGTTWSNIASTTYLLPSSSSGNRVTDIIVDGNNIYIATVFNSQNIYIVKAIAIPISNIIALDGTWTVPFTSGISVTTFGIFNNISEIFIYNSNSQWQLYSFSSGSISTMGSVVSVTSVRGVLIEEDKIIFDNDGTSKYETYNHNGSGFIQESLTVGTPSGNLSAKISNNTFLSDSRIVTLVGTGTNSFIEDLSLNNHLRYMSATTSTSFGGLTVTLSGTASNNGDLVTSNIDSGSINKVILTTLPMADETVNSTITTKINGTLAWLGKGSNYYLGTN